MHGNNIIKAVGGASLKLNRYIGDVRYLRQKTRDQAVDVQQITILAAAECATHIAGFPTLDQVVSSDINTFHGLYQIRNIPLGW